MSSEEASHEEPDALDYLSFVDYAVQRASAAVPTVDPQAMRLVLTLHRATSAMTYDLESSVHRPHGWSWSGFRVLFALWVAGPMEAKRAAELSGMSRAAISSLVNTLERDGLVSRTPATSDRRAVELALTEAGAEAITGAFQEHNQREQAWAETLTKPERTILIGLLEKLATGDAASKRRS
jgi:DNA-binding MarR family transcriptional regulator